MKVISEYTIKKLIQAKLLENYKKKLLTENLDTNSPDFKNQIISTGLIEALWVFLNDNDYADNLGTIANYKNTLNTSLEEILNSQNKTEFINKISKLPNTLFIFLKMSPNLLEEDLFTKLIANSNLILDKFNNKIKEIREKKAYVQKDDLYVIANHTTEDIKYNGFLGLGGIKNNIKEMISELLQKQPQNNITVNDVINNIKTLLPVLDANGSANTTADSKTQQNTAVNLQNATPEEIKKVGFAELKDKLNLSSRQLQKLNRKITVIANGRTNSSEKSKKYQALLVALTLKQATGTQNLTGATENAQTAVKDSKTVLITTLQSKQKQFENCYIDFKNTEELTTHPNPNVERSEDLKDVILYDWLTYFISNDKIDEDYADYSVKPDSMRNEFIKHLTLQTDQILINNSEIFILKPDIKQAAKDFFEEINSINALRDINFNHFPLNFIDFKNWITSYFDYAPIKNKRLILDYNFINYIQLKFLESKDISAAKKALEDFEVGGKNKIKKMSGEVITSENVEATTKECFRENNAHTDNFKLPVKRVLKKNYYQQMAEYLLEPDFPSNAGFGFINKNDVEKNAYAKKLKDARLNAKQIAKALKTLYPKAGDFKTEGNKEKWIATYYLNINVDEIIAAANDTSTSDPDAEETETDTAPTKDCLLRDNGNKYNFKLLSKEKMKELINKPKPASDDYRKVMAELLLDLDEVPTGYGFTDADKIKFKAALDTVNPKLTVDQIKNALADIYPKSANPRDPKNKEQWHPEYYININPHEIIKVAKKH